MKKQTKLILHTQIMKTNGPVFYADSKCSHKGPMTYKGMIMDHKWNRT
jgi:hypothetical protein